MTEGQIEKIVDEIVADIRNRSGLDNEWDAIDGDIQEEIKTSWVDIIKKTCE